MELKNQTRTFQIKNLRAEADGEGTKIVGYAATFGTVSRPLFPPMTGQNGEVLAKGLKEKIEPGAFREAIQNSDVRALFNHNPDNILGRTASGTLKLEEDEIGLRFELELPDTQAARDLTVLVKRGDLNEMSFAFNTAKGGVRTEELDERFDLDVIEQVERLFDVSLVAFAQYPNTFAAVRSLERLLKHGNEKDRKLVEDIYQRIQSIQPQTPEGHEPNGDAEHNQNNRSETSEGQRTKEAEQRDETEAVSSIKRNLDIARRKLDLLEIEAHYL